MSSRESRLHVKPTEELKDVIFVLGLASIHRRAEEFRVNIFDHVHIV